MEHGPQDSRRAPQGSLRDLEGSLRDRWTGEDGNQLKHKEPPRNNTNNENMWKHEKDVHPSPSSNSGTTAIGWPPPPPPPHPPHPPTRWNPSSIFFFNLTSCLLDPALAALKSRDFLGIFSGSLPNLFRAAVHPLDSWTFQNVWLNIHQSWVFCGRFHSKSMFIGGGGGVGGREGGGRGGRRGRAARWIVTYRESWSRRDQPSISKWPPCRLWLAVVSTVSTRPPTRPPAPPSGSATCVI